jgi:hypothetical protein
MTLGGIFVDLIALEDIVKERDEEDDCWMTWMDESGWVFFSQIVKERDEEDDCWMTWMDESGWVFFSYLFLGPFVEEVLLSGLRRQAEKLSGIPQIS